MAEKDEALDLDAKEGSSNKKIIIFAVVGALLLVGITAGVMWFLLGGEKTPEGEEAAVQEEVKKTAHYLPLKTMVVNFGSGGPARFLQVDLQVMAHSEEALTLVEENMPAIRNEILLLLGNQSYEQVNTREGKEALRQQIVERINTFLSQQLGEEQTIETVYFTSFVMQ